VSVVRFRPWAPPQNISKIKTFQPIKSLNKTGVIRPRSAAGADWGRIKAH
jgi:hypothetical protein